MNDLEQSVLTHLVDAWNSFLRLPIEHSDDIDEFRHGIHALQKQIMARPTRREMNKPLSIQERTDAAVKAERERSERLSHSNFCAKAGEDAQATIGDASDDPVSRAVETSRQKGSIVEIADGCQHGGSEEPAAADRHAPIQPETATKQRVNVHSQHEANPPGQATVQNECVTIVGSERGTFANSINERCGNPDHCKFSHHPQKVTCSACTSAWAAKTKTAVAA